MPNYRQIFAKQKAREQQILKLCPNAKNESGIYCFYRFENGFKFAYVGQATKSVLHRLAEHLGDVPKTHIDRSIKKHKLYSKTNPTGWQVKVLTYCEKEKCNDLEQFYIKVMADKGYQMRNHTSGSQGNEKTGIVDNEIKGYNKGKQQGFEKCREFVRNFIEKGYVRLILGSNGKIAERKYKELLKFLEIGEKEQ